MAKRPFAAACRCASRSLGELGTLPKHGFARKQRWEVANTRPGKDFTLVTLRLVDNEETRALWPHAFAAEMSIAIGAGRLDIEFEVENTGDTPFSFTAALHTYLKVKEVEAVRIEGCAAWNTGTASMATRLLEMNTSVIIEEEVDRIYHGMPRPARA